MTRITVVAHRDDWPHLQRLIDHIHTDYEAREFYSSEYTLPVRLDFDNLPEDTTSRLREIERTYVSVVKKKTPPMQSEERE
jgi:hypothetical protein